MQKQIAIARIKEAESAIRALGAAALYLFGSTARDEARSDSDVDLFVDREPQRLGFSEFFDLQDLLEQTLNAKVDLATRESLHPVLRSEIETSAIRVL